MSDKSDISSASPPTRTLPVLAVRDWGVEQLGLLSESTWIARLLKCNLITINKTDTFLCNSLLWHVYTARNRSIQSSFLLMFKSLKASRLKKFSLLDIEPYNKDISDHIQCSTALLWWMVQSWKLELIANVIASWKQQRLTGTQLILWKTQ